MSDPHQIQVEVFSLDNNEFQSTKFEFLKQYNLATLEKNDPFEIKPILADDDFSSLSMDNINFSTPKNSKTPEFHNDLDKIFADFDKEVSKILKDVPTVDKQEVTQAPSLSQSQDFQHTSFLAPTDIISEYIEDDNVDPLFIDFFEDEPVSPTVKITDNNNNNNLDQIVNFSDFIKQTSSTVLTNDTINEDDVTIDDIVINDTIDEDDVIIDDIVINDTIDEDDVIIDEVTIDDIVINDTIDNSEILDEVTIDDIVINDTIDEDDVTIDDIVINDYQYSNESQSINNMAVSLDMLQQLNQNVPISSSYLTTLSKDDVSSLMKDIDNLLEFLPDEKIEELAHKDFYYTYIKFLDDLGI